MPTQLWSAAPTLSPRIKQLRDQYWSFYEREYTNQVRAYTTGTPWDCVYSIWSWTNVPEVALFQKGFRSYLAAAATPVKVPESFWNEPLVVRQAMFFREVVSHYLPAQILDGELIVGSHFSTALSRCLDRGEARARDNAESRFLKEWHALNDVGVGNCGAVPGHLVPDYPKVLRIGWKGIQQQAEEVGQIGEDPRNGMEGNNLPHARAITICADAARILADRYEDDAYRRADAESSPARREELREIARNCAKVPWLPAETFPEALQSLWMTHMLAMAAESYPGPGVSPGRVDQYLYPYFKADLDAGRLTRAQAKEWLECWWIKHNYAYDYQGWVGTNQGINSSFGQLITLGGMNADGGDASNELTYLMLDVIEEINLLEPKPNIRIHARTPDTLLKRVIAMLSKAQGSPFLINFDENAIAGLRWAGLPEERLWDYAPVGCLENTLAGDDRSGTVDVNLNIAKAVELVLNDGRDLATGKQIGPQTGDPRDFPNFPDFLDAFKQQLHAILERLIDANDLADAGRAQWEPVPYMSALVGGCLESGKDANAGGARYNFLTVEGVALATAADSLAAVKKLVFETRQIEMSQLLEALQANFDGYESLRQTLLNKAPKYGNDDPYADEIAREISRFWTEETFKYISPTGKRYRGGYLSWNYWIAYAPTTAATPDGRHRGQFLSNAVCPVNGADRKGPTSVIKSVGNLGLETVPNGASHTMSFSPAMMQNPEMQEKLMALLRAYGKVGGTALQVNVIDADTLRAAQKHPDEYRNLLVRVTGYNAYFVGIGKEIQDEIIARESHALS
ncbi:MAG: formate C-acetyltransferase/glycerol dehydratase family glycyl radical enzyme [Chloroflexi bacterium]|nr:formate C-acetyltransferase/glycerol dehydratase family glycyl radical enzyme [Chloroflexota bacterium]